MFNRVLHNAGLGILCISSWLISFSSAYAEIIEHKLASGYIASAEYHKGESKSPSIILLHGFLQTRESPTIARLFNALVDSGYTVLAPNLTLGISHRKQSLACEAIHSHSMQSDIAELEHWSRWLHKKSADKIILIGHSTGSVHQIAYMDNYANEHIKQGIFISVSYFGVAPASNETVADSKRAQKLLKNKSHELSKFGLSYCKDYVSSPKAYLSYYNWQQKKLLSAMKKIKPPITVIIGSQDQRLSKSWINSMKKTGINISTVTGAGHFFDNEFEFDLQDTVESILQTN